MSDGHGITTKPKTEALFQQPASSASGGGNGPQVSHAGLSHLSGRRPQIQISAAASGWAGNDAGAIPREVEVAGGLSDGGGQLRGAAIGVGEEDRAWSTSQERWRFQARKEPVSASPAGQPRRRCNRSFHTRTDLRLVKGLVRHLIPKLTDQNRYAQSRRPMDMILQGWSTSLFQASQQWSTISW